MIIESSNNNTIDWRIQLAEFCPVGSEAVGQFIGDGMHCRFKLNAINMMSPNLQRNEIMKMCFNK